MVRELHVYDFDNTLYSSLKPAQGYGLEWYALPHSLPDAGPPGFDPRWNLRVVQELRKSLNNPNARVALLTARPHNVWLHKYLTEWMLRSGLHFDLIQLRPLELKTESYKALCVAQWMTEYPEAKRIVFWDDHEGNREAVRATVLYAGRTPIVRIP